MAAMARLNRIWWCNTISFTNKFKLYKSLVTSILLYGCETMTLLADSEKRIQVFKTKCMRKPLHIFYLEHKTNNWVRSKINFLVGMPNAMTASPKPSFRAPSRVGNAMVSRGNSRWTTSKSEHPCPCKNC